MADSAGSLSGDAERIASMLEQLASLTEEPNEDGVTRLAFTPKERLAHKLFACWMEELGLTVRTDVAGNTIAERAGTSTQPAIGTGSHLDSVPKGGRFDGITGVVAAVEVARLLKEKDISHRRPFRFVVFAGEEGARFGQACIGSKAVGGLWTTGALEDIRDADGVSIADAMTSVGLSPERVHEACWTTDGWAGFIELHVEQGQVLETEGLQIGIVDQISGSTRLEVTVSGTATHTGSTPMELRADALTAAAEMVLLAEEIANDPDHDQTRCTVGKLAVQPGSITTIPGRVVFSLDVRDIDGIRQRDTAGEFVRRVQEIAERRGVGVVSRQLSDASPAELPTWISDISTSVCKEMSLSHRVMFSGASHDTQMVNNTIPAGLIFVPSHNGLSHVPEESTEIADIATGVEVLIRSLLELDHQLCPDES